MRQLTVRGVPEPLGRRLKELSAAEGKSLNAKVIELLSEAVGLNERREWLKRFMTATEDEVSELDAAVRAQRTIDENLWR